MILASLFNIFTITDDYILVLANFASLVICIVSSALSIYITFDKNHTKTNKTQQISIV